MSPEMKRTRDYICMMWLILHRPTGLVFFCLAALSAYAQNPKGFDEMLDGLYSHSVAQVDRQALRANSNWLIIDARELEEFEVSHIPGALFVGFKNFSVDHLGSTDRAAPIVVYCSVGHRSEKIGEQLQLAGFENVYNLRGGIFDWVNHGFPVVDESGHEVERIHPYNQKWSKWINDYEIVYE